MSKATRDLTILGGGLAGLGLAYQVKRRHPELDIQVIERARFPRPAAVAKVGESTVEIGSRYLAQHLELESHLKDQQLKKFGIRMFFGDGSAPIDALDELGASQTFGVPTYQIDRGVLENVLHERVSAMGVEVLENCQVDQISLASSGAIHGFTFSQEGHSQQGQSRWLVDAAGRRGLLKSAGKLAKANDHHGHAVWFRVAKRIEIDDWSKSGEWHSRCKPEGRRWLSTNHLTGPGYWIWIIPLADDITSFGIVMDEEVFAHHDFADYASALDWLRKRHPQCADALEGVQLMDYVALSDYSYSARRVLDDNRWALTGEAGVFADPLYSPGSDFIAIGNTLIEELISCSVTQKDWRLERAVLDRLYLSIYDNTLSLYQGQYGGFGDRNFMALKLLWDYTYYWGVLALLYFRGALHRASTIRELSPALVKTQQLNQSVQAAFREAAKARHVRPARGLFIDQYALPCLRHFNDVLMRPSGRDIRPDLDSNLQMVTAIAGFVQSMLKGETRSASPQLEAELLGEYRKLVTLDH